MNNWLMVIVDKLNRGRGIWTGQIYDVRVNVYSNTFKWASFVSRCGEKSFIKGKNENVIQTHK